MYGTLKEEAKRRLAAPSKDARGYTRWWWYGCNVEKEEIKRELDEMVKANIGGVELQILYALEADDYVLKADGYEPKADSYEPEADDYALAAGGKAVASAKNGGAASGMDRKERRNHFYLSPEYLELVAFAAEEANKRGMKFDVTLGSAWPYGGPFVPEELSAPTVIPYTIDVKGPCRFSYDFTTRTYGEIVSCVMGRMENCEMVPDSIRDITDKVRDKYLFHWPWGEGAFPSGHTGRRLQDRSFCVQRKKASDVDTGSGRGGLCHRPQPCGRGPAVLRLRGKSHRGGGEKGLYSVLFL